MRRNCDYVTLPHRLREEKLNGMIVDGKVASGTRQGTNLHLCVHPREKLL